MLGTLYSPAGRISVKRQASAGCAGVARGAEGLRALSAGQLAVAVHFTPSLVHCTVIATSKFAPAGFTFTQITTLRPSCASGSAVACTQFPNLSAAAADP